MRKTPILLAGILALALIGGAVAYRSQRGTKPPPAPPAAAPAPAEGSAATAPPFILRDTDGNIVDSSQFRGKPLVVNFFATYCPPCREEVPGFVAVHRKYRERGFEIVGISLDTDTRASLPLFVAENRIGYRIVVGDLATARAYGGVHALPTTFFIGRDGRIRKVHEGYINRDDFDQEVQKIL